MLAGIIFDNETQSVKIYDDKFGSIAMPYIWLRDHCTCEECQHPETKQRQVNTFDLPEELNIHSANISSDWKTLTVAWQVDPHCSIYPASLFDELRLDPENLDIKHKLWTANTFPAPYLVPQVQYENFMKSDEVLLLMLEMTEQYGFCFVEGTPPDEAGTKSVASRIAYTRETIFGGYYEMTANLEHKDTAYTPLAIGPHTDGTYSNDAPSYQVLHCLEENCVGGENVLIDGFKIADVMRKKYRDEFLTLQMIEIPGQYIDTTRDIHLMARRPIFKVEGQIGQEGRVVQVSYNNHDRAPFFLESDHMEDFYRALNVFARLYNKEEFHYRRKLQPGSCLFFDNWRLLHARDAYTGYRKLAGVYFNKEDVESKLRVLRKKQNTLDIAP